jgi:hypothetical protein
LFEIRQEFVQLDNPKIEEKPQIILFLVGQRSFLSNPSSLRFGPILDPTVYILNNSVRGHAGPTVI